MGLWRQIPLRSPVQFPDITQPRRWGAEPSPVPATLNEPCPKEGRSSDEKWKKVCKLGGGECCTLNVPSTGLIDIMWSWIPGRSDRDTHFRDIPDSKLQGNSHTLFYSLSLCFFFYQCWMLIENTNIWFDFWKVQEKFPAHLSRKCWMNLKFF